MGAVNYHANKGLPRNKKPLKNIVYEVTVKKPEDFKEPADREERYRQFKFKEEGYLILHWWYEFPTNKLMGKNWHGFITPEDLKALIGDRQWKKFCEGKRIFIAQRRVDGKNIRKEQKEAI